jgi:hypothetical protein
LEEVSCRKENNGRTEIEAPYPKKQVSKKESTYHFYSVDSTSRRNVSFMKFFAESLDFFADVLELLFQKHSTGISPASALWGGHSSI